LIVNLNLLNIKLRTLTHVVDSGEDLHNGEEAIDGRRISSELYD